jgi:hypothetical protein
VHGRIRHLLREGPLGLACACLAAACAGAGIATAASSGPSSDVIKACVRKADGVLRLLPAPKAGKRSPQCGKRETAISWNKQGPTGTNGLDGAAGPAGGQGPAGAQGPAGLNGSSGERGADGPRGPTGADGTTGPTGADGQQGPGTTEANAFDFSTNPSSNTRRLASIQGFEFYAACSSSGVSFYATNTNPQAASIYQQVAGSTPTFVTVPPAGGGNSTPTTVGSPVHVTFMAPRATNAFVVELWGSSLGGVQCHAAGVRTSAVPN